ncbi:hypothetical protein BJ878DRAFT_525296 [Calycina marina]|uniref:Uncharacterized protein n=1 Tax=Calycina marina TaxID=1763456 RepID=A0A9P8CBH1_9HELO|nr:hypothetical protein BJ878DRAFT_525296 [Calycina marina]
MWVAPAQHSIGSIIMMIMLGWADSKPAHAIVIPVLFAITNNTKMMIDKWYPHQGLSEYLGHINYQKTLNYATFLTVHHHNLLLMCFPPDFIRD